MNTSLLKTYVREILSEARYVPYDLVSGKIYLPTASAIALWKEEILGQMSDGMWENSRPDDHWKFWNKLTPELGEPKSTAHWAPSKNSYNLGSLIPIIGDRMIKIGQSATPDATYTIKDLKRDLLSIKQAMKNFILS